MSAPQSEQSEQSEQLDLKEIKKSFEFRILTVFPYQLRDLKKDYIAVVAKIENIQYSDQDTIIKNEILALKYSLNYLEANLDDIGQKHLPEAKKKIQAILDNSEPSKQAYRSEVESLFKEYEKWLRTGKRDGKKITIEEAGTVFQELKTTAWNKANPQPTTPPITNTTTASTTTTASSTPVPNSTPSSFAPHLPLDSISLVPPKVQVEEEKDYDAPPVTSPKAPANKEPTQNSEVRGAISIEQLKKLRENLVAEINTRISSLGKQSTELRQLTFIRDQLKAMELSHLTLELINQFRNEVSSVHEEPKPLNLESPQMQFEEVNPLLLEKNEAIAFLDGLIAPLENNSDKRNTLCALHINLGALSPSELNSELIQGFRDAALKISTEGIVIEEVQDGLQDKLLFGEAPLEVPAPHAYAKQPLVNQGNDKLSPEEIASFMQQFASIENRPPPSSSPARKEPVLADRLDPVQANHVVQPTPAPEPTPTPTPEPEPEPEPGQNKVEQNSQDANIPASAKEIQTPAPEHNEENDHQNQAVALLAELSKKNSNQADCFEKAYKLLGKILQEESTNQDMQIKARGIHKQIMTLKGSSKQKYLPLLTETMLRAVLLTLNPLDNQAVSNCAKLNDKIVKSMPNSRSKQMLCGLVTALGLTAIALGILVCVGTLGFGAVAGIILLTAGTVMTTGGAGLLFFNRHTDAKETKMLKDLDSSIKDFTSPQLA